MTNLTAAKVAKIFSLPDPAAPLTPLGGRSAHRGWRLDTFDGSYFVKQYDRPFDMPTWNDWIRAIQGSWEIERAAFDAGLPIAAPVMAPGAVWPWVDIGLDGQLATVRVHRWVTGTLRSDPATVPVASQLGEFLGRTHRLLPPLHEWRRGPRWPMDWDQVVTPTTDPGRPWVQVFLEYLPDLQEAATLCAYAAHEPVPLVLTHRDLHSHNVIEQPDGQVVVIDWDAASTQRSDWELVEAALELAGYLSGPPDPEVVAAFVGAYRSAKAPRMVVRGSSFAGLLMCAQNWVRHNVRRAAATPADHAAAAEAADQEVLRSLVAVRRVLDGMDDWAEWFA